MSTKLTTEDFIVRAIKVHGNLYDYSLVNYVNYDTNVRIICNEHGEFYQEVSNHLQGKGCRKCAFNIISNKFTSNTTEFVKKAMVIHEGFFNYNKSVYIDAKTKIEIICPTHGSFWQKPNGHLNGNGCPLE